MDTTSPEEVIVPKEAAKQRLDAYLAEVKQTSRSYVQLLINQGQIQVNNQPAKGSTRLKPRDVITLQVPNITKDIVDVPVLYEDDDVMVFNKPAGMLTHSKGTLSSEFTIADAIEPHTEDKTTNRPGIVHRLDRDTSGVIITAKTIKAKEYLQKQFANRRVRKNYLAVVSGSLSQSELLIKLPIERNPKHPQTFRVGKQGKMSETYAKVLGSDGSLSLVRLEPHTGRTHQLRVHLAYLHTPIIGDAVYGNTNEMYRLQLHAWQLELILPSGKQQIFTATVPPDMQQLISEHRLWPQR